MRYENEQCPVCGKTFSADDEVVVCPECGTPQHKSCYNELGKCVNDHMHSSGFVWTPKEKEEPVQPEKTKQTENVQNDFEEKVVECTQCGAKNREGTLFCLQCGNPLVPEFQSEFIKGTDNIVIDGESINNEEHIDSDNVVTVREAATFIQKNKSQYIKTFLDAKSKSKMPKFNISAFVFGPLWFFYRKIHKVGLALAGIYFAISCFMMSFFVRTFHEYIKFYIDNYQNMTDENVSKLVEIYGKCLNTHQREMMYIGILVVVLIVLNIIFGFFANKLYLDKIKTSVQKIKMLVPNDTAYFNYLFAKGGTTLLGAFNAAFLMYILLNFVSSYVL